MTDPTADTQPPHANLPTRDWTPDQPLRHDATDEQIRQRWLHLSGAGMGVMVEVAREYAEAVAAQQVAAQATKVADTVTAWIRRDYEFRLATVTAERNTLRVELERVLRETAAERDALRAEVERLREFVAFVLRESSWKGRALYGGDAEDKAEALGLLFKVQRRVPCGESCACEEYDHRTGETVECYRFAWATDDTPPEAPSE